VAKKKIKNTKRKPNENPSYYFVGHVDSEGNVTPLLFTDLEFKKGKTRAAKNPEDVPFDYIVFTQAHKDK
jgi:hypothetical protein